MPDAPRPPERGSPYRKRPVVVHARRTDREEVIETLEGTMTARPGDWIVTGVEGERYPVKPYIFAATYAAVEPSPSTGGSPPCCPDCIIIEGNPEGTTQSHVNMCALHAAAPALRDACLAAEASMYRYRGDGGGHVLDRLYAALKQAGMR